ncbi:MAG: superoxide dismutase [Balneola sp.]|nr:MAG: superoxide dismutase [Balneola sp.]
MRIIAIERETPGLDKRDFVPHLRAEALQGWKLYREGIIREMYFRDDKPEAVLILECKDLADAEKYLATLPLVEKGLISFELIPLKPYHGFERLFARNKTL